MRPWRAKVGGLLFLALAALRPVAAAEDEQEQAKAPDPPLTIDIDTVVQVEQVSTKADGKAFAILGTLRLERRGIYSIRAQRAMIWLDPRVDTAFLKILEALKGKKGALPLWGVRAIYAEGGRAPVLFQAGGQIIRASSMYYDLQSHEGVFLGAELRLRRKAFGPIQQDLPDLVARAERFRSTGPGTWSAHDVTLSSTDYIKPEIELRVGRLDIRNDKVREALGKIMLLSARDVEEGTGPTGDELQDVADSMSGGGMQDSTRATMHKVRARAFGLPFFGWRKAKFDGGSMDPMITRFSVGNKGSIGNGVYAGGGRKTKPVGWYVGAGTFSGRGPLVDGELWVNAWERRLTGHSIGAFFNDGGTDFDGTRPESRRRYWTSNRYRFEWTKNLRFDTELALLSDSNFLRIYDEREFKQGKEQETMGYLRYRNNAIFATLIYKWRTIDFAESKQELPSGAVSVPNLTLLRLGEDGQGRPILLQLGLESQLGNLNFRQADGSTVTDFRTARFDVDPRFFVAFNVGAVRITPFAAFRFTAYEQGLGGSSETRYAGSAGVRADVQFGRWFGDVQHVVNVAIEYEDLYDVSVPSDRIYQMDPLDRITKWRGLGVRLRNRFMSRTATGQREFLNFELFGTWFPDDRRALGRPGEGFLELDLKWFPSYKWLVETRALYNWDDKILETGSIEGRYIPRNDLRFFGSIRHLHDDSDIITGGTDFEVDSRWRILLFTQWDIRTDGALDQALLIQRMGKTFMLGINVRYRVGEDRFTLSFKFDLLESFRTKQRKDAEREFRRAVFYPGESSGIARAQNMR